MIIIIYIFITHVMYIICGIYHDHLINQLTDSIKRYNREMDDGIIYHDDHQNCSYCDDRGNDDVNDGTEEEFCEYDALTRGQRMVRVIAGCSNSSNCSLLFSARLETHQ